MKERITNIGRALISDVRGNRKRIEIVTGSELLLSLQNKAFGMTVRLIYKPFRFRYCF